jgi:hypothetical protein
MIGVPPPGVGDIINLTVDDEMSTGAPSASVSVAAMDGSLSHRLIVKSDATMLLYP